MMLDDLAKWVAGEVGSVLLIKDSVACKGSFVLHHLLRELLVKLDARVVFLGLSEPFSHYSRIARKQGCNLQAYRDKGHLIFLEQELLLGSDAHRPSTLAGTGAGGVPRGPLNENSLAPLYLKVRESIKKISSTAGHEDGCTCVMIDDVSLLEVLATGSWRDVLDFLHYCRTLTSAGKNCSMVLLLHHDICEETSEYYLHQELEYTANTVLNVEPLSTGLASDIHGQVIMVNRTPSSQNNVLFSQKLGADGNTNARRLQFCIMESAVTFSLSRV